MSAAANARWIGAIQFSKIAVQLLSLLALSRLLSPADFGLVAIASVVTSFAALFRDLGTAAAVIQRPELDEAAKSSAFWLNAGLGLGLGLIVALIAPMVSIVMKAPELTGLLLVIACVFPVTGTTTVHQALLERASQFALIARIEIISMLTGFAVAIGSAVAGAGPYSLVFQSLAIALLSSLLLWTFAGWRPKRVWSRAHVRELWSFSRGLFAFNLVNYLARNADSLLIGRFLGPTSLGAYTVAYRTMLFPLHNLTFVASRALFPVMSRRQTAVDEVAKLYFRSLSIITFFTAPLMAGLFVLREPFVEVVLGEKWAAVAAIIAWLAPVGFIQSIISSSGAVFMALGRTTTMFRISAISTLVTVTGFAIGLQWGVTGVAASYLFTNALMAIPTLAIVLRCLNARPAHLVQAIQRPIAMGLAMALLVFLARSEILSLMLPHPVQLVILVATGGISYFALAHYGANALERDVLRVFSRKA